jgi:mannose-6-phosphate isomerase-like protein (cupin superfamily)
MKISLRDTETFDVGDFKGALYLDKKDNEDFNVLLIDCVTRHFKMRLVGARRTYFVLEGSGTFAINDERIDVEPFDLVLIKDGDVFEYDGAMKLFEFNIPATDDANEERLE